MNRISFFVIDFLMGAFRSRLSLQLEIAALHHQLSLYQRAQRRPAIASSDRLLWSVLARLWRGWRGALFIVQPRTVILWQRKRFRDYWRGLSRGIAAGVQRYHCNCDTSFAACGRPIRPGARLVLSPNFKSSGLTLPSRQWKNIGRSCTSRLPLRGARS